MRPSLVSTQRPTPCPPAETQQELHGDSPFHTTSSRPRGRRRVSVLVATCVAAIGLGASTEALAQDQLWLKDRRYTEGAGIRLGDFELHPGLAAEFGYDSNYLRRSDDGTTGALRLRITPSLSLSTLGPQRSATPSPTTVPGPDVDFRSTLSLTYNEFFPVNGQSSVQQALGESRNISGNLDLNLNIFPRREWSGSLYAGIGRAVQPSESGAFQSFEGVFDRFLTRAGAELAWAPGAGLLDWRLGYRFSGTIFQQAAVSGLTNIDNTIQMRGRWRFLPRTAMLYDARLGFINYVNSAGGGGGSKGGSHPVRVQLGVNGLITSSFGILAMVGYGASFYDPVPSTVTSGQVAHDFDSVIGQAEVKWYLTPNPSADPGGATLSISSLSLGFIRDFQDSYLGTFVERDRGYANLSYFFGGRFLVVVDGGAGPIVYPRVEAVNGVPLNAQEGASWTDIRYDASVLGEYRVKDYFGINATVRYTGNASSKTLPVNTSSGTTQDSLQWQSFEAYLGARFLM